MDLPEVIVPLDKCSVPIKAVVLASPGEGMSSHSAALLADGEDVTETCQVPWVGLEALPVMAM